MDLIGPHGKSLKTLLDYTAEQHRVIQKNMANVNTPGFKAKKLAFDKALEEATEVEREGINPRQDGNTVVMEVETAEMQKNSLAYRLFLMAMQHEVRLTKSAIAGRGQ